MRKKFIYTISIILIIISITSISYAKYLLNISTQAFEISTLSEDLLDTTSPAIISGKILTKALEHDFSITLYSNYDSQNQTDNILSLNPSDITINSSTRRIFNLCIRFSNSQNM